MANPVLTYIQLMGVAAGTPLTAQNGSSWVTANFQITAGWEIRIPFQGVMAANVSAGPEIYAYRGIQNLGGTPTYETIASRAKGINRRASGNDVTTITLDTGYWCLALCTGGPNTATVGALTGEVVTGIIS